MKARRKFLLWVAGVYAVLLAVPGTLGALLAAGLTPAEREAFLGFIAGEAPLLAFAALILFFVSFGAVKWLFDQYPTAVHAIAEQTRIVPAANTEHRVSADAGPEIAEMAARSTGSATRTGGCAGSRSADGGARRLEEERNRLAALMSELSEGVLLCNEEGRILLYNEQARALFAPAASGRLAAEPGGPRPLDLRVPRPRPGRRTRWTRSRRPRAPARRRPTTMFSTATVGET